MRRDFIREEKSRVYTIIYKEWDLKESQCGMACPAQLRTDGRVNRNASRILLKQQHDESLLKCLAARRLTMK
jgi:hypothetical protein